MKEPVCESPRRNEGLLMRNWHVEDLDEKTLFLIAGSHRIGQRTHTNENDANRVEKSFAWQLLQGYSVSPL